VPARLLTRGSTQTDTPFTGNISPGGQRSGYVFYTPRDRNIALLKLSINLQHRIEILREANKE
jgi:hypothetical protein